MRPIDDHAVVMRQVKTNNFIFGRLVLSLACVLFSSPAWYSEVSAFLKIIANQMRE